MNNRGFTLVELLAVMVVLGLITSIGYISINGVIKANNNKQCEYLAENIKTATKEYVSDNRYSSTISNSITAKLLTDNNYLTLPITNPYTKDEIDPSKIEISIVLKSDYTVDNVTIKDNSTNPINFSCNGE